MTFKTITILYALSLVSCSNSPDIMVDSGLTDKNDSNPKLIKSSHKFEKLGGISDSSYLNDHANFIAEYFSVEYSEKQINAYTLMKVHCSDSLIGRIDVRNDTIFLKKEIIRRNGRPCPEYHSFHFNISNPENKRFVILSEQ